MDYLKAARAFASERGLGLHLDGARLFNAAVACGLPARDIAGHFDSVSVCLSKGLGAPVGSVLVGSAALIEKARRWKKVTGGGWRQAGMLAAAAQYALDHHVDRLADDHARAVMLAAGLGDLPGVKLLGQHTNMVFIDVQQQPNQNLSFVMKTQFRAERPLPAPEVPQPPIPAAGRGTSWDCGASIV